MMTDAGKGYPGAASLGFASPARPSALRALPGALVSVSLDRKGSSLSILRFGKPVPAQGIL